MKQIGSNIKVGIYGSVKKENTLGKEKGNTCQISTMLMMIEINEYVTSQKNMANITNMQFER